MINQRIALLREAQSNAATNSTTQSILADFSRTHFYHAVITAIQQSGLYLEGNTHFFCEKLQLPYMHGKAELIEFIKANVAARNAPLELKEVVDGLSCINAVINIGIKGKDNIECLLDEIWGELKPLLKEITHRAA